MNIELDNHFLDDFRNAIKSENTFYLKEILEELHTVDISAILDELDSQEVKFVLDLMQTHDVANIIANLEAETRKNFIEIFSVQQLSLFITEMDSDDAADLLQELDIRLREKIIEALDKSTAEQITDLLAYEEGTAGALMAKELIRTKLNWTVVQCIDEIRRQAEEVEKVYSLYVVDDQEMLVGRVSLKSIILAKDDTLISDLFIDDILAVQTYQTGDEVADLMQKYDLESIPVTNVNGKLVGRITIDDVVDHITEQAEIDQQVMAGLSENIEADDSIWKLSWARLPWLLVGMMGGLLGAQFIGQFEADLSIVPAMAFFIPLITATGGNVGIQSSTIVVQSLADNEACQEGFFKRMVKVFAVALLNGVVIGLVVFGFNTLFIKEIRLAAVVSIALFAVVVLASFMGTITPLVLNRFGINPALASGPFITTANDLLGLAVYFMLARLLFDSL